MISQLIIELSEKGEPKAAKELAIAYLKHEKDVEIRVEQSHTPCHHHRAPYAA